MPQLGPVIDSIEFARSAGRLERRIAIAALPRLADLAVQAADALEVSVCGSVDGERRPMLDIVVRGQVECQCQRCLAPVVVSIASHDRLLLVEPGQPWPDEDLSDDELDAIEASRTLDIGALVEEEVLLALPLSPRHETCELPAQDASARCGSPFAALERIKHGAS